MDMWKLITFLIVFLIPTHIHALERPMNRVDGFLLIWQSILRPAFEVNTLYYRDVQDLDPGFREITYARRRKILDEEEYFRPRDPLLLSEALIWIYRTRNILYPNEITPDSLSTILERYPLLVSFDNLDRTIDRVELLSLMHTLDSFLRGEVHEVSFYAEDFHGRGTAFGEQFDMNELTAAHRTLPHNTLVKVMNVDNGKSVVVRINDRGPYVDGRDMDLSLAAFEKIAPRGQGILNATFERLGDKSLAPVCGEGESRYHKRITRDLRFHRGVPHQLSLGKTLFLGSIRPFVVRWVEYPDGNRRRLQDFVLKNERFSFTPSIAGTYTFTVGTIDGRRRDMRMHVVECAA
jgi:hypothetical protein